MTQRTFLTAKFLVPVAVLVWLLISLPLWVLASRAEAQSSSSGPCPSYGDFATGGQSSNDAKAATNGVWGMDYENSKKSHLTVLDPCFSVSGPLVYGEPWSDGDLNYYLQLSPTPNSQAEVKKLQRWSQAKNRANFLEETVQADQGDLPPPCSGDACGDTNISYIGALGYDNNHGWKELHPAYSQTYNGDTKTTSHHQTVAKK
jgi:hypothetical protein